MFPYSDPQLQLEMHHQRVAEMIREAADHRRSSTSSKGRHRRFGRWPGRKERSRATQVTAAA